jgi:hypothetical protein
MRIKIFLLFYILSITSILAGNSRSLEWFHNTVATDAFYDFKGSLHSDETVLPYYSEMIMPEVQADNFKVEIAFPVFEKLKNKEIEDCKLHSIDLKDSLVVSVFTGTIKKKTSLELKFIPYIKKGSNYYRLTAFDWKITPLVSGNIQKKAPAFLKKTVSSSSVLKTGKWKKLSVTQSGMYKITWDEISAMGFNPDKVQIYGYGGALLEENFSVGQYYDDLPENAVWKSTGSDGIFNKGDFLLFYAQGPVSWKYDKTSNLFKRVRNHYSDKAYYFIGERESGTLITETVENKSAANVQVSTYTDCLLHEYEKVNIGESVAGSGTGRELYGEDFTTNPVQTKTFNVSGVDMSQKSFIQTQFVAHNTSTSTCDVYVNDKFMHTLSMYAVFTTNLYTYATSSTMLSAFTPESETLNVKLSYNRKGNSSTPRAFLNYIILNVRKYLKAGNAPFIFRDPSSVGSGKVAGFTVKESNANTMVFDITDPVSMKQIKGSLNGTDFIFNADASTLKDYVCLNLNGEIPGPKIEGDVTNQDIHSYSNVDMVIISAVDFLEQAKRLAKAHTSIDGLNVLVVTPEQVYNEFSSGTPDATAYRLLMKYYYDKAKTNNELPKYLLLFGGGVYDNRMVSTMFTNDPVKKNHILTYQSVESVEGTQSFVTDDYFGFLDDTEGADLSGARLDIGIGRFPVNTVEEAVVTVDKTIGYMENRRKGIWKNRLLYIADDGDENIHTIQAESLASKVESRYPEFMVNRIYVDAFKKVTTASGAIIPDGRNRFAELLNSGLLMLNYTGHGSTTEWTAEKVLTSTDVKSMTNKCLPLWVTATCDFTRYDSPEVTGGELAFLNKNGGSIALFTTTRIVYSTNNNIINQSFTDNIFSKNNGVRNTLGEIMHLTKISESLRNDRNKLSFTLIGDPALKLAYPEYSVKITQINGKDISLSSDTFKALDKVVIKGKVYREDGSFANDFNGLIFPTVLDSRELVKTLGSNGADIFSYYDQSKVLFSGKDSVLSGEFSFTFLVPKDISYSYGYGKINLYAYDESGKNEAQGVYDNFVVGGTNSSAITDTDGPVIKLYLNDKSFTDGGYVNETPSLIAEISDVSGLNTSGNGIGHDLQVVLDGDPDNTFVVNNYYMADIGNFSSGTVRYVLPEISEGAHNLIFKAWDVQNNSSTAKISFIVSRGQAPVLSRLRIAQQSDKIIFRFDHNRPEVAVNVRIDIFDIVGRLVWSSAENMLSSENSSDKFEWDMRYSNGKDAPSGIYVCKVIVTDSNGSFSNITEKLRLFRQ